MILIRGYTIGTVVVLIRGYTIGTVVVQIRVILVISVVGFEVAIYTSGIF